MHIFALASSHVFRVCDETFYFLFFGFTHFTHDSFILFFILKKKLY